MGVLVLRLLLGGAGLSVDDREEEDHSDHRGADEGVDPVVKVLALHVAFVDLEDAAHSAGRGRADLLDTVEEADSGGGGLAAGKVHGAGGGDEAVEAVEPDGAEGDEACKGKARGGVEHHAHGDEHEGVEDEGDGGAAGLEEGVREHACAERAEHAADGGAARGEGELVGGGRAVEAGVEDLTVPGEDAVSVPAEADVDEAEDEEDGVGEHGLEEGHQRGLRGRRGRGGLSGVLGLLLGKKGLGLGGGVLEGEGVVGEAGLDGGVAGKDPVEDAEDGELDGGEEEDPRPVHVPVDNTVDLVGEEEPERDDNAKDAAEVPTLPDVVPVHSNLADRRGAVCLETIKEYSLKIKIKCLKIRKIHKNSEKIKINDNLLEWMCIY